MKKAFSFLFLFILLVNLSFAQNIDDSEVSGEFLQQYQTFSWKRVAKAKKYEIEIEKQLENGEWKAETSDQTTDTRIEILLYPGNYRVALSVFNALGRKTSTTDWTPFIILNETQPYLYADSLRKSVNWKSPLLNVRQAASTTIEEVDDEGSVTAREGDPTNSIFLKGKNIFFPTTTFSLVPKAQATEGRQFEAFVNLREEVPLEIIRRDTENSGVVLSYDPQMLFSGYYDVVAKNPGGQTAQLELLVFIDEIPKIDTSKFGYNENYKVNTVTLKKDSGSTFTIQGKGFGNNTVFTLKKDDGLIPYPFTSNFERKDIDLQISSHNCLDKNGNVAVTFTYPENELFTGYYVLSANNGSGFEDSVLLLVDAVAPKTLAPEITKLKSKPAKAAGLITYHVNGEKIDANTKFSLISSYSEEDDTNKKFEVSYVKAKRNGTLHVLSGDGKGLTPGRYALLMENESSSDIIYVDVNENQKFEVCEISSTEVKNLFYRPVSKEKIEQIFIPDSFEYYPLDYKFKEILPVFMSSMMITEGLLNGIKDSNDFVLQWQLCILNFNWFRWNFGMDYYITNRWGQKGGQFGTDVALEIPGTLLRPYVSAGYYRTFAYQDIDMNIRPTFERNGSIPLSVGFKFANFIDFRYSVSLENIHGPRENWFAIDRFSVGANIPLHAYKYNKKAKTTTAAISQNEIIDGTQYKLQKNTRALVLDSPVVTGFNGIKKIRTVNIGPHVQEIGMKAFADCTDLEQVTLNHGLNKISSGAFKNDKLIKSITIPSTVKTVEKGAFEGMDSSLLINLQWTSDDETPRSLEGLDELESLIYYSDHVIYVNKSLDIVNNYMKDSTITYYAPNAWKCDLNGDTEITSRMVFVKNDKNESVPGICFEGCFDISKKLFSKPQKIAVNTDVLKEFDSVKSGKPISGIRFKAEAEGDVAFRLYLTDYNGNVFDTNFDVELDSINDFKIDKKISSRICGMYFMVLLDTEDYETSKNYKFTISNIEVY